MPEDLTTEIELVKPASPDNRGMTVKVMKGSFWVLMGQVLPLFATFVASPFVIRLLGSESYGVLILVGLISSYFSFADFGMVMASTKFGSEAYASGSSDNEGSVIRTAALIGVFSSLLIAIPMFIFSGWIVSDLLKVPEHLHKQASIALKITSIAFVMSFIGNIFNTPQLSRMRMDLNVLINSGFKILMTLTTPIVLYFGGGIVQAIMVTFVAAFLIMSVNIIVSGRLQPSIFVTSINQKMVRPLLKFGGNLVLYSIGLIITNNLEKFLLTRYVSVKSLAYYSVAFTFANMTTMFSMAMVQTLLPAFSQLLTPDKREQLKSLFNRCVRVGLISMIPSLMVLLIIAKPFFTIWAGKEFGINSIFPFYVLLAGVFFSLLVYVPNTILLSSGRSHLFARFYLVEILPYAAITYFLINWLGIIGAAMAWSLRETVNAFTFIHYAKKHTGLTLDPDRKFKGIIGGALVFLPPALVAFLYNNFSPWIFILLPFCLAAYFLFTWKKLVNPEEREWIKKQFSRVFKKNNNPVLNEEQGAF